MRRHRLGKLTYSHLRAITQWNISGPSLLKDCPNILRTHDLLPGPSAWLAKLTPWLWTAGFSESPKRKNRHLPLLQCVPSSQLCAAKMSQDHLVLLYIKGWLRKNGRSNAICAYEMAYSHWEHCLILMYDGYGFYNRLSFRTQLVHLYALTQPFCPADTEDD